MNHEEVCVELESLETADDNVPQRLPINNVNESHNQNEMPEENKFKKAFDADDFEGFEKHLNNTFFHRKYTSCLSCRPMKSRTDLFDERPMGKMSIFEEILTSKENTAAKYISLALKTYSLWSDEQFFKYENNHRKTLMHYAIKSLSVENFFSFLMFDWFNPDANQNDRNYLLVLKSQLFFEETGNHLLQKLYEIIDNDKCKLYQNVCLRMIYQYLHELDQEDESQVAFKEFDEYLQTSQAFLIRDFEYREQVLQILVVFWRRTNDNKSKYEEYKSRVMNEVKSDQRKSFFKLAFLLIEKEGARFEKLFLEQTEHQEKLFGDYFEFAVKSHVRLLSKIVQRQDIQKTIEFIFNKCPFIEVNSTVMSSFYDVQDFRIFNLVPYKSKQLKDAQDDFDLRTITKLITNYDEKSAVEMKRFLFGHNIENTDSVFERILSTPDSMELIKTIWSKFDLCTREEILRIKNPQGKYLLNYVIESNDDNNLLAFLMPEFPADLKLNRKRFYLKMQNDQFIELTGRSLYEQHLIVCANDVKRVSNREDSLGDNFFLVVFSLLEEIGKFQDIRTEVPIDKLLALAQNEKFYVELLNIYEAFEDPENIEEWKKKRYFIDDLLANIVAYWTTADENYYEYEEKIMKSSLRPFFVMIFDILEDKQELFVDNFHDSLSKLEDGFKDRYGEDVNVAHYTASFMFVLLIAAMKNDRRQIIDRILDYETFVTVDIRFPSNMQSNETSHYVAKRLLEHGHEIGKNQVPSKWISPKVFKEFLDSRVKYDGEELVEINNEFLLHSHTKKYQIKSKSDVDNKLTFWEDTDSLKYILKNESLKEYLTHPTVSAYIELKCEKYKSIYYWNLGLFLILFVIPFAILIGIHFNDNLDNNLNKMTFLVVIYVCPLSIIFLLLREVFQLKYFYQSWKKYFENTSNVLEVLLIFISIITWLLFYLEFPDYYLNLSSLVLAIVVVLDLIFMISSIWFVDRALVMKTVWVFLKIFLWSLMLSWIFVIVRTIYSSNKFDDKDTENSTEINLSTIGDEIMEIFGNGSSTNTTADDDDDDNFTNPLIQILADNTKGVLEAFIEAFVIFFAVLGMVMKDFRQRLSRPKNFSVLKEKAEKFIETSNKFLELYKKFSLDQKEPNYNGFFDKHVVKLSKWLISKHPFIHKVDKIYINIQTKKVCLEINQKLQNALGDFDGKREDFFFRQETYDSVREIIFPKS